jgi:hypothetical protein
VEEILDSRAETPRQDEEFAPARSFVGRKVSSLIEINPQFRGAIQRRGNKGTGQAVVSQPSQGAVCQTRRSPGKARYPTHAKEATLLNGELEWFAILSAEVGSYIGVFCSDAETCSTVVSRLDEGFDFLQQRKSFPIGSISAEAKDRQTKSKSKEGTPPSTWWQDISASFGIFPVAFAIHGRYCRGQIRSDVFCKRWGLR